MPKPLDRDDRDRVMVAMAAETLPQQRDHALLAFLLSTGCRIAEALALNRGDVRRDHVTVRGKGDRERIVMLTQRARRALRAYPAARTDSSPALFISFQRASQSRGDHRLTSNGARYICRRVAGELALAPFHPHQLRHTLGTVLQETIGDARLTAETLGHRGLDSVAGYTKVSDRRRRVAYAELETRGL